MSRINRIIISGFADANQFNPVCYRTDHSGVVLVLVVMVVLVLVVIVAIVVVVDVVVCVCIW